MKYFVSIIGVMVSFLLLCFCTQENGIIQMGRMGDFISLLSIMLVLVPILISTDLHKDFIHAFRLALSKTSGKGLLELKRAKEAVDLALKSIIGSGVLVFSVGAIESFFSDAAVVAPNLGVSTIGLLYASVFSLFLIPIQVKLKVKIMEYMGE